MIRKNRQTSVIKRMYAGFTVMVALFVATVILMLNGTSRIHSQLESVTSDALPLVSLANQTSVKLLSADKIFKDFLTSQDPQIMLAYEKKFKLLYNDFSSALKQLSDISKDNPALNKQLSAIYELEERYFSESNHAMENYRAQLIAQQERQKAIRHFQQLQTELRVGMKEYINEQDNIAVKLMAKSYFAQLKKTETITSDALASYKIEKIRKAIKNNKRSVTRLNYSYSSLTAQLPSLKDTFDDSVKQFTQDVGKKGGVLDLHFSYVEASNSLYANISVLAAEVDQAMVILDTFRSEADQLMNNAIASANKSYTDGYACLLLFLPCFLVGYWLKMYVILCNLYLKPLKF